MLLFGPPLVARFGSGGARHGGKFSDQGGPLGLTLHFLAAVYGGFYGGGIGILILAILGLLGMEGVQEMNGLKMLLMVTVNALAVAAFVTHGAVAWPQAGVMMAGSALGGHGGAWCTRRLPAAAVRWTVIVAGGALTVCFFLRR